MNKKNIATAVLIIILAFVGWFYFRTNDYPIQNNWSESAVSTTSSQADCATITDPRVQSRCYLSIDRESGDISSCDSNISDEFILSSCYLSIILKNNLKADVCSSVQNKDLCYRSYAVDKNDIYACGKIADTKIGNDCLLMTLISNEDTQSCTNLTLDGKNATALCLSFVAINNSDYSICSQQTQYADACFSDIAEYKKDISICNNVKDSTLKSQCQDYIKNHQ